MNPSPDCPVRSSHEKAHKRKPVPIRNSARSSDRLWLACRISTRNISTWSKGGRPPRERSARGTALSRSGREKLKIQRLEPLPATSNALTMRVGEEEEAMALREGEAARLSRDRR